MRKLRLKKSLVLMQSLLTKQLFVMRFMHQFVVVMKRLIQMTVLQKVMVFYVMWMEPVRSDLKTNMDTLERKAYI